MKDNVGILISICKSAGKMSWKEKLWCSTECAHPWWHPWICCSSTVADELQLLLLSTITHVVVHLLSCQTTLVVLLICWNWCGTAQTNHAIGSGPGPQTLQAFWRWLLAADLATLQPFPPSELTACVQSWVSFPWSKSAGWAFHWWTMLGRVSHLHTCTCAQTERQPEIQSHPFLGARNKWKVICFAQTARQLRRPMSKCCLMCDFVGSKRGQWSSSLLFAWWHWRRSTTSWQGVTLWGKGESVVPTCHFAVLSHGGRNRKFLGWQQVVRILFSHLASNSPKQWKVICFLPLREKCTQWLLWWRDDWFSPSFKRGIRGCLLLLGNGSDGPTTSLVPLACYDCG